MAKFYYMVWGYLPIQNAQKVKIMAFSTLKAAESFIRSNRGYYDCMEIERRAAK